MFPIDFIYIEAIYILLYLGFFLQALHYWQHHPLAMLFVSFSLKSLVPCILRNLTP